MSDCFQLLRPDSIRLGWALIYFLWQGVVIAIVLEIAMGLAGQKNAALRSVLCGMALAAMPLSLATTYLWFGASTAAVSASPLRAEHAISSASPLGDPSVFNLTQAAHPGAYFASTKDVSFDPNRYLQSIVTGWVIGVLLLSGRKAGGFIVLWRLRRHGVSDPGDALTESFRQLCCKLGVSPDRAYLKISSVVQVPMTMGWIRPVVLFPAALLSGLTAEEVEFLLAHELAHIRRCDYLINLVQTVVETLFFYHPATWWISRRMRQEREHGCDDLVAPSSIEALAYAKVLLRLESIRQFSPSLSTAANGGDLLRRVERLLGGSPRSRMGLPTLLILLSLFGFIATLSVVNAQTSPTADSEKVPVAKPAPTPENIFAQPITMKETKGPNGSVSRQYYQGGHLILQQYLNVSPGSVGQLVFYQHTVVVDDRAGSQPIPFSSRFVPSNNLKIEIQSIAADTVSPAELRILDSSQNIISDFLVDKNGVMRPVTKAEHDQETARRKAALDQMLPENKSGTTMPTGKNSSSLTTPSGAGKEEGTERKLKSMIVDRVDFNHVDVSEVLRFFAQKAKELDVDGKGINFVLGDLSHIVPRNHVHREFTVSLENVPLISLFNYLTQQTNLKWSIGDNTVYFNP